jgi:hypothetical protein
MWRHELLDMTGVQPESPVVETIDGAHRQAVVTELM